MSRGAGTRAELEAIFRSALAAVDAAALVRAAIAPAADGLCIADARVPAGARLRVLAVGKAAVPMAAALEEQAGERIAAGLAVAPGGEDGQLRRVALCRGAHPVPDASSQHAAVEAAALVDSAGPADWLVVLLSGGASSLLAAPAPGLSQDDLARTTALLLAAGCDIDGLNAVRKHLSSVSGGRLACRTAARVEVLALSDVPGDRLDVIGSGPFAPDPTSYADALAVLARHALCERVPEPVRAHLEAGARGEREETPKPGDARLARVRHTLLASNRTAVEAARVAAEERGLQARCACAALSGEARRVGRCLGALARAVRAPAPLCLVAGGETVVQVRGGGRGGRNQELALAAALELDGRRDAALLAAGTDGRDGPTDAAGAFVDGGSVARGRARGVDAAAALAANDSHGFFRAEGGLFETGPTGTNVMDLVLLRIG